MPDMARAGVRVTALLAGLAAVVLGVGAVGLFWKEIYLAIYPEARFLGRWMVVEPADTVVEAVNAAQGLVVLSGGSNRMVSGGDEFLVYRGAEISGTIRVIRVYDDLSGARIVHSTEGRELQVGDVARRILEFREDGQVHLGLARGKYQITRSSARLTGVPGGDVEATYRPDSDDDIILELESEWLAGSEKKLRLRRIPDADREAVDGQRSFR